MFYSSILANAFAEYQFKLFLFLAEVSSYPSGNVGESSGSKSIKTTFHKKESKEDTKRLLDRLLQDDVSIYHLWDTSSLALQIANPPCSKIFVIDFFKKFF